MIRDKNPLDPIVIDLTGPDGNAYALIGKAMRLAKQLGYDAEKIKTEMMASDYENLLQVFDSYFGDIVILER